MGIFYCPPDYTDQLIEAVSNIEGSEELIFYNCYLLTSIPNIEGLKYLNFQICPLLKSIPHIKGLKKLSISNQNLSMSGSMLPMESVEKLTRRTC